MTKLFVTGQWWMMNKTPPGGQRVFCLDRGINTKTKAPLLFLHLRLYYTSIFHTTCGGLQAVRASPGTCQTSSLRYKRSKSDAVILSSGEQMVARCLACSLGTLQRFAPCLRDIILLQSCERDTICHSIYIYRIMDIMVDILNQHTAEHLSTTEEQCGDLIYTRKLTIVFFSKAVLLNFISCHESIIRQSL